MTSTDEAKSRAAKLSISLPEEMLEFIDTQCRVFDVGRSTYFQMLLDEEQRFPRTEFIKQVRCSIPSA